MSQEATQDKRPVWPGSDLLFLMAYLVNEWAMVKDLDTDKLRWAKLEDFYVFCRDRLKATGADPQTPEGLTKMINALFPLDMEWRDTVHPDMLLAVLKAITNPFLLCSMSHSVWLLLINKRPPLPADFLGLKLSVAVVFDNAANSSDDEKRVLTAEMPLFVDKSHVEAMGLPWTESGVLSALSTAFVRQLDVIMFNSIATYSQFLRERAAAMAGENVEMHVDQLLVLPNRIGIGY